MKAIFLPSETTVITSSLANDVGGVLVGFLPTSDLVDNDNQLGSIRKCIGTAMRFLSALEDNSFLEPGAPCLYSGRLDVLTREPYRSLDELNQFRKVNPVARAMQIRARLAHLTGDAVLPTELQWDPELQDVAKRLQRALTKAASYIFREVSLRTKTWRQVRALIWSVPCAYSYEWGWGETEHLYPLYFFMHRQQQNWFINEYHLAAVMSLWRHHAIKKGCIEERFGKWERRKIFQVSHDLEATAAVIRFWVGTDCVLDHANVRLLPQQLKERVQFRLSAFFDEQLSSELLIWQPYTNYESSRTGPEDQHKASILCTMTPATLLEALAQDIFTIFMFEVASIVGNLGEIETRQLATSSMDRLLYTGDATSSLVKNIHIDTLAAILHESGLATKEAALMSIVPAFFHQRSLPSLDATLTKLLSDGSRLRDEGSFRQAETHLKRLLRSSPSRYHQKVARALGEVYRRAMRSPTPSDRDFGFQAMSSLRHFDLVIPEGSKILSGPAKTTFLSYGTLADSLKRMPARTRRAWGTTSLQELTVEAVDGLRKHANSPRSLVAHSKMLLLMETYNLSSQSSAAIQELLLEAIALGYLEVIEDLRHTHPNLLTEPAFSNRALRATRISDVAQLGHQDLDLHQRRVTVGFLAVIQAVNQLNQNLFIHHVRAEAEDVLATILDWFYTTFNPADGHRDNPLLWGVESGDLLMVDTLLRFRVDLYDNGGARQSLFSMAASRGDLDIAFGILSEHERRGLEISKDDLPTALSVVLQLEKYSLIKPLLLNNPDHAMQNAQRTSPEEPIRLIPADPDLVEVIIYHGKPVPEDVLPIVLQTAISNAKGNWIRHFHSLQGPEVVHWCDKARIAWTLGQGLLEENHYHPSSYPLTREQIILVLEALLEIGLDLTRDYMQRKVLNALPPLELFAALLNKDSGRMYLKKADSSVHKGLLNALLTDRFWRGTSRERLKFLEGLIALECDLHDPTFVLDTEGNVVWAALPLQLACLIPEFSSANPQGPYDDSGDRLSLALVKAWASPSLTGPMQMGKNLSVPILSSPLTLACLMGKVESVKALLRTGIDVNCEHLEFGTPLQAACLWFGQRRDDEERDVQIVRALLRAGARVNAWLHPCGTALIAATFSLLPRVVEVLLEADAHSVEDALKILDKSYEARLGFMNKLRQDFTGMQRVVRQGWECLPPRARSSDDARRDRIRALLVQYRTVFEVESESTESNHTRDPAHMASSSSHSRRHNQEEPEPWIFEEHQQQQSSTSAAPGPLLYQESKVLDTEAGHTQPPDQAPPREERPSSPDNNTRSDERTSPPDKDIPSEELSSPPVKDTLSQERSSPLDKDTASEKLPPPPVKDAPSEERPSEERIEKEESGEMEENEFAQQDQGVEEEKKEEDE
jgi:ankyrin repeat protein